jgi:hypothetical protein
MPRRSGERAIFFDDAAPQLSRFGIVSACERQSLPSDERQQVGVDGIGIRGRHSMRETLVGIQRAVLEKLRRKAAEAVERGAERSSERECREPFAAMSAMIATCSAPGLYRSIGRRPYSGTHSSASWLPVSGTAKILPHFSTTPDTCRRGPNYIIGKGR